MTSPPAQREIESAAPPSRRTLRRAAFPGLLALGWMVYLLAAAGKTFFVTSPILADAAYFEAALREMLLVVAVGLTVLWPLVRLSQREARPAMLLLLDAVVLLVLAQIVIWPLAGKTRWSVVMLLQLDAVLAAWTVLAAGIVALGVCVRSGWLRSAAMLVCLGAMGAATLLPMSAASSGGSRWLELASPLAAVWRLRGGGGAWPGEVWLLAGTVAGAGVLLLALAVRVRQAALRRR